MTKKYFFMTILGLLISSGLIVLSMLGFMPFDLAVFVLIFLVLLGIALRWPRQIFWLFIILLPLETIIVSPEQIPFSLRSFQLVGVVLIIVTVILWLAKSAKLNFKLLSFKKICIVCKIKDRKACEKIPADEAFNFLDKLVFLLPFISLLGIINAPDRNLALKQSLVFFSFVFLYWLARNYLQTKKQKLEALWFFLIGSLPVIFLGIYQAVAFRLSWQSFQVMTGRINATFTEPDWLGIYLVFLVAIALWLKIVMKKSRKNVRVGGWSLERAGNWILNIYLFFLFFCILLTVSRSAWLGVAGVVIVYLILEYWLIRKIKPVVGSGLIIATVLIVSLVLVQFSGLSTFHFGNRAASSLSGKQKITISCEREVSIPSEIENVDLLEKYSCLHINLEEIEKQESMGMIVKEVYRPDPNVDIRKNIYQKTWQEIRSNFWIGQGLGSSSVILGQDGRGAGLNSSNIFLEVWFSMGILGLIAFGVIFFMPFLVAIKNVRYQKKDALGKTFFAYFVILTFVAFFIPNLFNAGLFLGFFWVWLAAVIGIIKLEE
jgi:O-Antigen ligase